MLVHLAAQDQRELDGAAHQFIPFEFRLPAGDIEGGDQLEIRRGAGVSEERLLEGRLRALPAIVVHHDVGTLTEAGERLVGRGRRIDPDLHRVGIRQQMGVEQLARSSDRSCRASS